MISMHDRACTINTIIHATKAQPYTRQKHNHTRRKNTIIHATSLMQKCYTMNVIHTHAPDPNTCTMHTVGTVSITSPHFFLHSIVYVPKMIVRKRSCMPSINSYLTSRNLLAQQSTHACSSNVKSSSLARPSTTAAPAHLL